ncbi:MAG TPA: hypothetical protein VF516_34305 [Kofleriaceae bacterium]
MRTWVMALMLLVSLGLSSAAADGGASESNVSFYVSEQFKAVAKRLVTQYIGEKLADACPEGGTMCEAIIARIPDAVQAAVDGDTDRLRAILTSFFVDSSIGGAVSLAVGGLATLAPESTHDARLERLGKLVRPLLGCLVKIAQDHRSGCSLGATFGAELKAINADLHIILQGTLDEAAFDRLVADPLHPQPADVVRILEAVASSSYVERPDLRQYLLAIEIALRNGTEAGVYAFVESLLGANISAVTLLRDAPADPAKAVPLLRNVPTDPAKFPVLSADTETIDGKEISYQTAFTACGQSQLWSDWVARRAAIEANLRRAVWLQQSVRAALDALAPITGASCASPKADAINVKALMILRKHALYLKGALDMFELRNRGAIVLAIAAVIDLVRTSDKDQFERHTRTAVAGAVDRLGWQLCVDAQDPDLCVKQAQAGQPVCQTALVSAVLRGTDPRKVAPCLNLNTKRVCKTIVSTNDQQPDSCVFPEIALVESKPEEFRKALLETVLTKYVEPYREKLVNDASAATKIVDAAIRCLEYLRAGDSTAARKAIARVAIEELLDHLKEVIAEQLHADSATCEDSTHSVSLFSGLGAKCAVTVLIEAAYYPIADMIWDGGIDASKASQIAESAYRSVLQSKLLAGSPILVNVGLGANAIWGADSVWGKDGYKALTVVDKFGLVFYRRQFSKETFEIGPFVGGFLDALVRTVNGSNRFFWLAGVTAGFPRIRGYNLGIELHAAYALPFAFESRNDVGYALGGVLVIPWDYWKEK